MLIKGYLNGIMIWIVLIERFRLGFLIICLQRLLGESYGRSKTGCNVFPIDVHFIFVILEAKITFISPGTFLAPVLRFLDNGCVNASVRHFRTAWYRDRWRGAAGHRIRCSKGRVAREVCV